MGCIASSPHQKRFDFNSAAPPGEDAPFQPFHFGMYATGNEAGSVLIPSHIDGLPSCQIGGNFSNKSPLYIAKYDEGYAFKCCWNWTLLAPCCWPYAIYSFSPSCLLGVLECFPICCWLRKELSTRTVYRIFTNRIEVSNPTTRFPWAYCGCGSVSSCSNVESFFFSFFLFLFSLLRNDLGFLI